MRIGINLLYLLPGIVGGTETYAAGLLGGLAGLEGEEEFVVFVNRESAEWPLPRAANFKRVVCPVQAANRGRRYGFEQLRFPFLLRRQGIDLVHSLGYVGPLFPGCRSVVTIHDLNSVDLAKSMPLHKRLVLEYFSTGSALKADRIITVSNYSKERLSRIPKLSPGKISVIYEAPGPEIAPGRDELWPIIKEQHGLREPYIAAFGGGTENKNIKRLIRVFEKLPEPLALGLVLIGHIPPDVDPAAIRTSRPDRRIIATGWVPGAHVFSLLRHASLFVLPSLYEGFGLPALEAQQAGTAVACSSAASLPEVAGEGAVYFDPESETEMAGVIQSLLGDADKRSRLRALGKINLERFSWAKTARETLSVYRRVLAKE